MFLFKFVDHVYFLDVIPIRTVRFCSFLLVMITLIDQNTIIMTFDTVKIIAATLHLDN